MLRHRQIPPYFLVFFLLSGCQSNLSNLYTQGFPSTALWSILPFVNLSPATGVGPNVERMVAVLLPSIGITHPELYIAQGSHPIDIMGKPAEAAMRSGVSTKAKGWSQSVGFAIGGEINDWFIDADGHAHVFLNIYVNDAGSGTRLWSANGSIEGMAGENIYDVSRDLIAELLKDLPINKGY